MDPGAEGVDAGQAVFRLLREGATHAPHHVSKEWSGTYKGKFDQAWDREREETFARQKELGVIPSPALVRRAQYLRVGALT